MQGRSNAYHNEVVINLQGAVKRTHEFKGLDIFDKILILILVIEILLHTGK